MTTQDSPRDWFNYAVLRFNQRIFDTETENAYRRALDSQPEWPEAHNFLGVVLRKQARFHEALQELNEAVRLRPDYAEARANRSLVLLQLGEYLAGWREYEQRLIDKPKLLPDLPFLYWQGENLSGRRILILGEQGFGDQIQMMRFIPLLARQGAEVELLINPSLFRLASQLNGIARVNVELNVAVGYFDYQCSVMSLPAKLGITLSDVPSSPYLSVDAEQAKIGEHKLKMCAGESLRVGLVWSGGQLLDAEKRRSLTLKMFEPLANFADVTFFSLQVGAGSSQLSELQTQNWSGPQIHDLTADIKDFADTAALMSGLDLIISCDTSTAHLAGALGKPVWILNRHDNCWRWLLNRKDSPWYPSARLFRQPQAGDWASVIEEVVTALNNFSKGD